MDKNPAKLVVIITEAVIEEKIIQLIKSLDIKGYTVYRGVTGEGDRGVRSGSGGISIFGESVRIEVVLSSEKADKIMRQVTEKFFKNYAGIVYAADVWVVRIDKFM